MNIQEATRSYETWLSRQTTTVPHDLRKKKELMSEATDAFPFFRGTFYRWAQLWPEHCPEFKDAPAVRCVGDLHVENFGTWRDAEGRLVWGVNDFDEAHRLPYVFDLVRLRRAPSSRRARACSRPIRSRAAGRSSRATGNRTCRAASRSSSPKGTRSYVGWRSGVLKTRKSSG